MNHFKGKQFKKDVIIVAVGHYLRYNLSYREVQEILYDRGIDVDGLTLDIWLRKKTDTQAAYAFLKRLKKQFGEPKVLLTDKTPSIGSAFKKSQKNGFYLKTEHRTVKYLNNLIEQDHRPIKRRSKFYQSLRTASTTIKGMETI